MKVLRCFSRKDPVIAHLIPIKNLADLVYLKGSEDREGKIDVRVVTLNPASNRKVFASEDCQVISLPDNLSDALPEGLPLDELSQDNDKINQYGFYTWQFIAPKMQDALDVFRLLARFKGKEALSQIIVERNKENSDTFLVTMSACENIELRHIKIAAQYADPDSYHHIVDSLKRCDDKQPAPPPYPKMAEDSNHPYSLEVFLRDCCSNITGAMVGTDVAYAEYLRSCESLDHVAGMSEEIFQEHMKTRGFATGLSLGNLGYDVFLNLLLR